MLSENENHIKLIDSSPSRGFITILSKLHIEKKEKTSTGDTVFIYNAIF